MTRHFTPATTVDALKKEARRLLNALRTGDERAWARLNRALRRPPAVPVLRDVQHLLAVEHGLSGWADLRKRLEEAAPRGRILNLIQPEELSSERPYGALGSRGCDLWAAIGAAAAGDTPTLRRLLRRDPRLAQYQQPIHFAVREGKLDAVEVLIGAGADAHAAGPDGEQLITVARDRGHEAVAQFLERVPGRRGIPTAEDHAIHEAAATGNEQAARRLLDADPELVHRADRKGALPLHYAVMASRHAMIRLLLERGADIHALHGAGRGDASGYAAVDFQPIDVALFWDDAPDVETTRLLLDHGAAWDLTIGSALGEIERIAASLDADPGRIREARPWGKRSLSAAVQFGHDGIARLLLDRGTDPTWPEGADAPRGSALHTAARAGNKAMVELLLDHGADPNGYVNASGTPTWAARTPEIRSLLLSHGGTLDCYDLVWLGEDDEVVRRVTEDPRAADAGCGGVFTAAATLGKRDLVVRLLSAGARVPPMVTGCRSYLLEDPEILRLLLASGMDPDLPDWQRSTLLHELCGRDARGRAKGRRVESATILLDAGATISARDEEYRSTPLAWAARNDLPDMVELLLTRGAPVVLPDDEPWATPTAWATRRGHTGIVEILLAVR